MHIHEKFLDDSEFMCDEIVNMSETESTETMDKKRTYKKDYYISHIFFISSRTIIIVSCHCYWLLLYITSDKTNIHVTIIT